MVILPQRISEMKDSDSTFFIELYRIELRTGELFLAATDTDIKFAVQKYIAIPFERETISRSIDNVMDSCNIKLGDGDYDKLAYICNGFDFRGCNVQIIKIVYPDSLTDESIWSWVFSGYIDDPSYSAGVFSCTLKTKLPNIEVPTRSCQLCCNSVFGDEECTMPLNETTLQLATGTTRHSIVLPQSYGANYWKDGAITIGGESRLIMASNGTSITITCSFYQENITAGTTATLIRGCDKTKETCKNRYNNMQHFSGFPAIPFESVYR